MKKRNPDLYFSDIISAVDDIHEYTGKMTKAEFFKDSKTQDAVIRKLAIIGEATKHLPTSFKAKNAKISWENVSGMRNILVHEYFGVNLDMIWKTIKEDLVLLIRVIKSDKK